MVERNGMIAAGLKPIQFGEERCQVVGDHVSIVARPSGKSTALRVGVLLANLAGPPEPVLDRFSDKG